MDVDEGLSVIEGICGPIGIHWHPDISHGEGISANAPPPISQPDIVPEVLDG